MRKASFGIIGNSTAMLPDRSGCIATMEGKCIAVINGFRRKECQRKGQSLTSKRHPIIRPANKKQNGGRGLIFDALTVTKPSM